ncbi:MAG: HEAT repeat protein [Candidatus Marinamargulisbacteria bacterium]|jgi:HEAT repeat protein
MAKPLADIIVQLRDEDTRWDAILELKLLQSEKYITPLIGLLSDKDWVVRWCVAEKLGEMQHDSALGPLAKILVDPDYHVRKNAAKALIRFGSKSVPYLVPYLDNLNTPNRRQAIEILIDMGKPVIPSLEAEVRKRGWVVGNQLIYCIWKIGNIESEDILIRALSSVDVRRNAIVFLGLMRSKKAIPHLVNLYKFSKLKREILNILPRYSPEEVYPVVIRYSKNAAMSQHVLDMIIKIGKPILPYLIQALKKKGYPNNKILYCIDKIGAHLVVDQLKMLAKKDDEVKAFVLRLKKKTPGESKSWLQRLKK